MPCTPAPFPDCSTDRELGIKLRKYEQVLHLTQIWTSPAPHSQPIFRRPCLVQKATQISFLFCVLSRTFLQIALVPFLFRWVRDTVNVQRGTVAPEMLRGGGPASESSRVGPWHLKCSESVAPKRSEGARSTRSVEEHCSRPHLALHIPNILTHNTSAQRDSL